ncbi:right-handed parallel beta-helix repeat-containing protein [Paraburkholderia sp. Ac-20342]|uniref:right-handed parallel beta-helix repeat-containing protein n=1 Tax=Paraburkholderia sp. Ac-20342 TaxID=2703889 RepID=UPI00197D52E0|nr:right-handed parallel beta-helix repeat-containing protein [Paraburkholderia sp. Ac-20342]MBN3848139.1 right-handed parallel beta-helix repeat-containing protein [Paraburkholderia sp. Ac-20342]
MGSLLPNGRQQFVDINGRPLVGGSVYFYAPGTENKLDTWQDQAQTIQNTNPVKLDGRGQATIWGSGTYRQVVFDRFGALVWDGLVSEIAGQLSSTGGSAVVGFEQDGDGAVGRTVQDKLREVIDLDDYATFLEACNLSVAQGRYVRLPGRNFNVPAGTVIPGGADVRGVFGQTTITITGAGALMMGGNRVSLRNITFTGGTYALNTNGKNKHHVERCVVTATTQHGIYCDSDRNHFVRNEFHDCGLTGIALTGTGAFRNKVMGNDGQSNGSFCFWVSNGANRNELIGNTTESGNAAELIGITYDSWGNRVIGNHAQGTLDNGISVTGYRNTVIGNVCMLNANHGIGIYGERNTVKGNTCKNNGQANLTAAQLPYAGITMTPAFGGLARKNVVQGNICDDDQAKKTQLYGVKVTTNSHIQWTAGMVVNAGTAFCFNGLNIYHTTTFGNAGGVPPTHTAGTVSDGTILWTWVASNISTPGDSSNVKWQAATNVGAGTFVTNVNRVYSTAAGGVTGATPPTHTAGTVSDGGVSWTFEEEFPTNLDGWDNTIDSNSTTGNLIAPWVVQTSNRNQVKHSGIMRNSVDGRQLAVDILPIAQNPEGSITAVPGSIAQRLDTSTTPGIALFSKQSGTGNVGWLPVALRHQGLLANRPDLTALGNGVRGYQYFATDIGAHGTLLTWSTGNIYVDLVTGNTYNPS